MKQLTPEDLDRIEAAARASLASDDLAYLFDLPANSMHIKPTTILALVTELRAARAVAKAARPIAAGSWHKAPGDKARVLRDALAAYDEEIAP